MDNIECEATDEEILSMLSVAGGKSGVVNIDNFMEIMRTAL